LSREEQRITMLVARDATLYALRVAPNGGVRPWAESVITAAEGRFDRHAL
jgi:hypothetical protein